MAMGDRPDADGQLADSRAPIMPRRGARRLKRFALGVGVLLVVLGVLVAGGEHYVSRPQFCGSCHIMEPYYTGWQADRHSGASGGYAGCVDCHDAPGQQHVLKARLRGLSQLMSYFSGRAGAGRAKAHVNDAGCLASKCHDDQAFMAAELTVGDVTFSHAVHLDPESKALLKKQSQLADLRKRLLDLLGPDRLAEIEALSRSVEHATIRDKQLVQWLTDRSLLAVRVDVLSYAELLHAEVRVHQLSGLKCASCHEFDASLQAHFSVAKTTCYTCHFLNQPFNANTAACLSCHEPPSGPVPVHAKAVEAGPASVAAVTMDHATIIANDINCVGCHADLVHGTGRVSRRDCQNCHDQQRYTEGFDRLTTEVVRDYHRIHAAGQHARCNDCHQLIQHELAAVADPGDTQSLLSPVRQDCEHCHPDHHRQQIELLRGRGGFVENAVGVANPMAGSRINCRACHTRPGVDPKGEAVITSTLESCRSCHSEDYQELFTGWQHSIADSLTEAQRLSTAIRQRLAAATRLNEQNRAEADRLFKRARHNIHLVATAGGLHNKDYAIMLLDQAIADLKKARELLSP